MLTIIGYSLLLACSCGFAFLRGGWPERVAAALIVVGWTTSILIDFPYTTRYFSLSAAIVTLDLAMLAGFALLAVRADRYWPIVMASLQLVTILAHLIKWIDPALIRRAYAIMIIYPAWLHLLVLMMATIRHMRRSAMAGPQSAIT